MIVIAATVRVFFLLIGLLAVTTLVFLIVTGF
jgi:hypothetical protein